MAFVSFPRVALQMDSVGNWAKALMAAGLQLKRQLGKSNAISMSSVGVQLASLCRFS